MNFREAEELIPFAKEIETRFPGSSVALSPECLWVNYKGTTLQIKKGFNNHKNYWSIEKNPNTGTGGCALPTPVAVIEDHMKKMINYWDNFGQ